MNTELLKSKLLEAAFNGSLTHAARTTWKTATVGEVASFKYGYTDKARDNGTARFIRITDILPDGRLNPNDAKFVDMTEENRDFLLKRGSLLMARTGATFGKTLYFDECYTAIYASFLIQISLIAEIYPKFYWYFSQSPQYWNQANTLVNGGAQPQFNTGAISKVILSYPPLAEQKRIVAALEEGFAYIDAVASAKQNLSETAELIRNKILQAAFDGSLTGADYSQSIVSLGDVCDIARGGSPRPIKQFITTREDGVNWIKIGDTEKGGKYINSCKEKIIPEGVKRSRMVHKGDFLLTNSMSFGRPYITNIDGCIHDGWLVISPHENTFDKDFLYYLLSSSYVFAQFSDKASGSTVSNLNIDKVIATTVPMPPITEQQRIVAKIEELFTQIDKITK